MRNIEVSNGRVIAGTPSNIAHLASPAFKDWNFRLNQAHIARLQAALPDLGESVVQTGRPRGRGLGNQLSMPFEKTSRSNAQRVRCEVLGEKLLISLNSFVV